MTFLIIKSNSFDKSMFNERVNATIIFFIIFVSLVSIIPLFVASPSNTALPRSFSKISRVFNLNPSSVKPSSVSKSIFLIKYPLCLSTQASPSSLIVPCSAHI